jgi:hypothetical protein
MVWNILQVANKVVFLKPRLSYFCEYTKNRPAVEETLTSDGLGYATSKVGVVAHYGPRVLHVAMHGVRAFFN